MVQAAGISDRGMKRSNNEDRYLIDTERSFFLVVDGMGGHSAGEVAADLSVFAIGDFLDRTDEPGEVTWPFGYEIQKSFEFNVLRTALELANLRVSRSSQEMTRYAGMGATAVAVWIRKGVASFSHVGDCRLYLLRDSLIRQMTTDHTVVQEQLNRGIITPGEAKHHTLQHVVTRAIGTRDRLEVELQQFDLSPGDLLLLCSDGVSDSLDAEQLRQILICESDLEAASRKLVRVSNERGGQDNITAVLVRYE